MKPCFFLPAAVSMRISSQLLSRTASLQRSRGERLDQCVEAVGLRTEVGWVGRKGGASLLVDDLSQRRFSIRDRAGWPKPLSAAFPHLQVAPSERAACTSLSSGGT